MSQIRRQSIISSILVYIGFALGFLNTYLFTREGGFTKEQYGLTSLFIQVATLMLSLATFGMPSFIFKFFPYYKANLSPKKNDMLSWALAISIIGFCLLIIGGFIFKDLVIRKFSNGSKYFVDYYQWVFPFGLGLTLYTVLEAYSWQIRKTVLTNFLREIQFRLFTTILILLFMAGILTSFDTFVKLYSFTYLGIALILIIYLISTRQFYLTLKPSIVSKKYFKKIVTLCSFVYGGGIVFTLSGVFDILVIAAALPNGLAFAGIYALAPNISSLIQAPQRGIISSSIAALSQAWKDKDLKKINRIYHGSSINQIIFSVAIFALIWLNFTDGVFTFRLQKDYLAAERIFFFIGLMRIIDMGTGVNAQIIATSTFWRFDFFTGVILVCITLPFNYMLTKNLGAIGPAIANLVSFSIYNFIRYLYLLKKFNMQPFNAKSLYTIILGIAAYYLAYFLFRNQQGLLWIICRSATFCLVFGTGVLVLKLSPDILPVWQTMMRKFRIKNTST
ncbi:MAG: polysaccharide biosynthesis C-terminal domain-containing protein [Chitinophagaceae bacterium]|nr:polysaccharide biosynthesis C-terminal domain-containing protein [Chitinophagaceae bacterium]